MADTTTSTARATVRYLRVSPYKVRQVLALVRGLAVDDAERALQLSEKDAADHVLKLLDSAVSNAEHNNSLAPEELYVAQAWCDEGPTRKWGQPRARGRYFRIRRRTSHVTLVLARYGPEELEVRRRREEATGRGAAAAQRRRAERVRRSRQRQRAEAHEHGEGEEHEGEEPEEPEQPEELEAAEAEAAPGEDVDVDDGASEEEKE